MMPGVSAAKHSEMAKAEGMGGLSGLSMINV
jgi:hypothetical protein